MNSGSGSGTLKTMASDDGDRRRLPYAKALCLLIAALCIVLAVWGVHGFGNPTLVELLSERVELSRRTAALVLSGTIGALATLALLLSEACRRRER
jgi:hypothetical protein